MKPGRDLDALVAEKVMGWTWSLDEKTGWWTLTSPEGRIGMCENKSVLIESGLHFPDYSTNISAAWEVVERIPLAFQLSHFRLKTLPSEWRAQFGAFNQYVMAETAPLAICLAALKAVGYEQI